MNTDFARNTLRSCPALLDAVLEFNGAFCAPCVPFLPQDSAAPASAASVTTIPPPSGPSLAAPATPLTSAPPSSPVPPIAGLDTAALRQQIAARRACSRRLCADETFWDFSREQLCVALLPAQDMVRLGTLFGAAVHARDLRLVVLREEVQRWQAALGRDVWAYALGRGQYQAGLCAQMFEAQGGSLSLQPLAAAQAHGLTPAHVRACGWAALQAVHHSWPEAVRRRVSGKWAQVGQGLLGAEGQIEARAEAGAAAGAEAGAEAEVRFAPGFAGAPAEAVWPLLKKILHKELTPAWTPYFS